jgi:putative acetyltransferase
MEIRRAIPTDGERLLEIWLRSVRATHAFVPEEDIQAMTPHVRDYLASSEPELWVLCDDAGVIRGFMGMSGSKMESLFLAPEFQRQGAGRRLVQHAQALHGELTVDVNEQNSAARGFYEACGFVVERRSELDDQGRPYPLLHLRLAAPNCALAPTAIGGWMTEVPEGFTWPLPWKPVPVPDGSLGLVKSAEAELQSEVCRGHPLYRVTCRAVAFNSDDVNEFLFVTDNPDMTLAFVHLTFRAETDPEWPYTIGYAGWDAFKAAWKVDTV